MCRISILLPAIRGTDFSVIGATYPREFKESIETKFGKLTTFATFFSAGNFHSEIKGIPIMSSLVDFGKYLIQNRIKANLTAAGNRINFLL